MRAVEAQDRSSPVRGLGGRQPVGHRHESAAPRRDLSRPRVEPRGDGVGVDQVRCGGADQVAQPGDGPHASADAPALVEHPSGHGGGVHPVAVVRGGGELAEGHRRDVGAQRQQHRPRVDEAAAERLHGLVVARGVDREPRRDPGLLRGHVGDVAEQAAGVHQGREQRQGHPRPLELRGVGRPVTGCQVDRPRPVIARGAVAPLPGEPGREVAAGARHRGHARVHLAQRLGHPCVHPAQHRLGEATVGVQHGPARPDPAQPDRDQVLALARERRQRLAHRGAQAVPQVVIRVHGATTRPELVGPQHHPARGVHRPRGVDHGDLRALRAAVDGEEVRRHDTGLSSSAGPSPSTASPASSIGKTDPGFMTLWGSNARLRPASRA